MKTSLLILLLFLISSILLSQQTIKLDEVEKHIGDSIKVCGYVSDVYYASRVENTPTFLNIGAKYPNQLLTVVIWNDVRKEFEKVPEELFKNKEICIIGRLELYKGKPQIVLRGTALITSSK
jgi:hypothetical protein